MKIELTRVLRKLIDARERAINGQVASYSINPSNYRPNNGEAR